MPIEETSSDTTMPIPFEKKMPMHLMACKSDRRANYVCFQLGTGKLCFFSRKRKNLAF